MWNPNQAISVSSDDEPKPASSLKQLQNAVHGFDGNYCCGGELPITTDPITRSATSANKPILAPPVSLRWDTDKQRGQARTVHFPLDAPIQYSHPGFLAESFNNLLQTCDPATFGRGGDDVLDEQYRKAGKLDVTQFSTSFHPHDYGVVDTIGQVLLPGALPQMMSDRVEHRGVLAELYKLNVYSGPGGKFQAHVDTPRGATQFGSLVVCLPNPFKGGQFRVSHGGHSTFFDWSKSANSIQWAAFYSDCEHEVMEVEEGHRVTLTYNLFVVENVGGAIQTFPTADFAFSPLLESAKRLLADRTFMKKGGRLGFYCHHLYAHNNDQSEGLMPYALKGIDVAIFSVFQKLGLDVSVLPVLQGDWYEDYNEDSDEDASNGDLPIRGDYQMMGDKFHPVKFLDKGEEGLNAREKREQIESDWPSTPIQGILWLNYPACLPSYKGGKGWEVAFARLAYGNQASLEWEYSHATITVAIPPAKERKL